MELFDHIRRVSFVFFVSIGFIHFIAGLLFANGYFIPSSGLINRVLFMPFILSTMTYGLSNLRYRLLEYGKNASWITYLFVMCGIVVFVGFLLIELFVMDSTTPLQFKN